ncbi:hypothetical protein D5S18_18645 [Nocardia panacis]|uniref:Uncharacterized protein n=1 Tax=Nocardia panacis TaxID=2340916 RepID=A0A3A4JVD5_9NOCA|nr:hypothetical protein [Nocardia panacis]RJO74173.1 hypothetical protein D5S18_18645 [Nocardia panacis]
MPPRKRATSAQAEPEFGTKFERLRRRAAEFNDGRPKIADYILGAEEGFDPPVRVRFPLKIQQREDYYAALHRNDVMGMMIALMGHDEYQRVKRTLDAFDDGGDLFDGLALDLVDHVNGRGAQDIPGGSPAS